MERAVLDNIAPVLVSSDLRRTAEYYRDVLGFELVENYENVEPFATLYRDSVEIVVVQAARGRVESNFARYGAGFDVYLDTDELAGVDLFYEELLERDALIAAAPAMTSYGSYEFVLEDIDGRRIGIGRIKDEGVFFKHSSQAPH
jgi:catechol 2,3-dioxygenase-like lactoylglutathione lyase family enzyme